MIPVISYCTATGIMYALSSYHQNRKYQYYTGWSRLQSIFCIPFVHSHDMATDLIYLNSFGCLISVHVCYLLTDYGVLHEVASRSLKDYRFYQRCSYKKSLHYIADGLLHGTPALLCVLYLTPTSHKTHVWILPAVSHVAYPYLLLRQFDPSPLYEVSYDPSWKIAVAWAGTFCGYWILSYFI